MWFAGETDSTAMGFRARGADTQPALSFGRAAAQEADWSGLVVWDEYEGDFDGRAHIDWVEERATPAA